MSKLRSTAYHMQTKRQASRMSRHLESNGKRLLFMRSKINQSTVFNNIMCQTEVADSPQQNKDHLYHRNISQYREAFLPRDSYILPFLSSLRRIKDYRHEQAKSLTVMQPFEASVKETKNQKIKKSVNDMNANQFRLSKASYRWNNTSGASIRADCEFECTLRLHKNVKNPELSSFNNTVRPIRYKTVEEKVYDPKELICRRQRKTFTLIK